ncbi:MAG: hypothetical protein ABC585_03990 [Candidatus Methanosuratincola petrocarbonis]|nr:hypothetical protein [Candidatus Methanosuratincola sp.]
MHVAITAILISVAMVAIVSGFAVGGHFIAMQAPKSSDVTLQTKTAELGTIISKNETGVLSGFSTGGLLMVDKELGAFNVTLSLPGGSQSILIGKKALCIIGGAITSAPRENFSVLGAVQDSGFLDEGSRVRVFNGMLEGERAVFIMPIPTIGYDCSASDLNVTVHSVRIIIGRIEGSFSAAGTFDLLFLKSRWKDLTYSRYVDVPGGVEISVDGVKALCFSVSRGDKVTVELSCVCYSPMRLR